LRKLYLDFDLSSHQLAEITGWSCNAISDFLRRENILKDVIKSSSKFGERIVSGHRISNKNELKIIQKILTLKSGGYSYREIAKTLNDNGLPAKRGGQWSKTTVQEIYKREQEKQK
jgi:DNA-binding transcriptional MerR regulator